MKKSDDDEGTIDNLHDRFGHGWFTCRDSKLGRKRIEELVQKGLLEASKEVYNHTINYRIRP